MWEKWAFRYFGPVGFAWGAGEGIARLVWGTRVKVADYASLIRHTIAEPTHWSEIIDKPAIVGC